MIENKQLHPEKLITHRFALTNYRIALSTATAKSRSRAIKVVFDFALLPASVVPNVRASARRRRSVTTTAAWPQEQLNTHEEPILATSPEEHFSQPASPFAPEPAEVPLPTLQSSIVEIEETPQFLTEEQIERAPQFSTEEQIERAPSFSTEEQPAIEDQSQSNTSVNSKPRRPRQSAKSQKTTEDIQAPVEAIGNTTGTNPASDTLEE
jgi:hypothetical protein